MPITLDTLAAGKKGMDPTRWPTCCHVRVCRHQKSGPMKNVPTGNFCLDFCTPHATSAQCNDEVANACLGEKVEKGNDHFTVRIVPTVQAAQMCHAICLKYCPTLKPLVIPPELRDAARPVVNWLTFGAELQGISSRESVNVYGGVMLQGRYTFHVKDFAAELGFKYISKINDTALAAWVLDSRMDTFAQAKADLQEKINPWGIGLFADTLILPPPQPQAQIDEPPPPIAPPAPASVPGCSTGPLSDAELAALEATTPPSERRVAQRMS